MLWRPTLRKVSLSHTFCAIEVHVMKWSMHRQELHLSTARELGCHIWNITTSEGKTNKIPPPKLQCFSPVPFAALGELPIYTPCIFLFFKKILMQLMWQGPCGEQDEIPCQKPTLLCRDTVLEVPGSQLNNALARIKHPDPLFFAHFKNHRELPPVMAGKLKAVNIAL